MKAVTLICLLFLLTTCDGQKYKTIAWNLVTEKKFKIPNADRVPLCRQTIRENGKDYLLFYNREKKQLLKFDLASCRCTDSIPIKVLPDNQVWGIRYLSRDSIFIAYNASQNKDYNHSGTLVCIDRLGAFKASYPLKGLPVTCSECGPITPDSLEYISMKYGDLLADHHRLFFQLENYLYNPGDSAYTRIQHPVGGHVDLSGKAFLHPVYLPAKPGDYYSKRAEVVSVALSEDGNPVYAFNTVSALFEYNLRSGKVVEHALHSRFGNSVLPLAGGKPAVHKQDDYTQVSFERLVYNPWLKKYLRFTRLALPADASPESKRHAPYGITVLNTHFAIVGEGILPAGLSDYVYPTRTGFGFWKSKKTQELLTDTVYFAEYTLDYNAAETSPQPDVLPQKTNVRTGFEGYVADNFKTAATPRYILIFLPLSQACSPCIAGMASYARTVAGDQPLYLLLADNNKDKLAAFRKEHRLVSTTKVLEDTSALFNKYLEPPVVNGLVAFYENARLIREMSILPGEGDTLKASIQQFLNNKPSR